MSAQRDSQQLWLKEVIQPKLETLLALGNGTATSEAVSDLPKFLKSLLEDLEHLNLDNSTVELYVEKIIDGAKALENQELRAVNEGVLKSLALNSLVSDSFDRFFYLSYWTEYQPLLRRNPELNHANIMNAFRMNYHVKGLANYLLNSLKSHFDFYIE